MILGRTLFVYSTASLFLLLLVMSKRSYRPLCRVYTAVIALIAFFTSPKYDLYNYIFGRMRQMANMSFSQFLASSYIQDSSEPIAMMYFYVLSKFPYKAVLMLFTVLIVYGLIFSFAFHVEHKYELSKTGLMILLIWIVGTTPYYTVLGGIRNHLAFTIFGVALYFELVEKRHRGLCWCGFVVAVFIHNSTVVLLLIRILLFLYKRLTGWMTTAAVFVGVVAITPIINVLSTVVDSQFLMNILDKASGYYGGGGSSLSIGNWIIAGMMVLYGVIAYFMGKRHCSEDGEISDLINYLILLLAFCLGSITCSDVFSRFGTAVKFASFPLFAAGMHAMQLQIDQTPRSQYIRHTSTTAGSERMVLEMALLISAGMFLGYQYLGKLTLMNLQWPPV